MFLFKKKRPVKTLNEIEIEQKNRESVWEREKAILLSQKKIDAEREVLEASPPKKKIATSKILTFLLLLNFFILEIFIGVVTIYSLNIAAATGMGADFGPLLALIAAVIGETLTYWVYSIKSAKENTEGGISYMLAKHQLGEENGT